MINKQNTVKKKKREKRKKDDKGRKKKLNLIKVYMQMLSVNVSLSMCADMHNTTQCVRFTSKIVVQITYLDFHDSCHLGGGGGDGKFPFWPPASIPKQREGKINTLQSLLLDSANCPVHWLNCHRLYWKINRKGIWLCVFGQQQWQYR